MDTAREHSRQLAHESIGKGDAIGWFEQLYAEAQGDAARVPWANRRANPLLTEWLERQRVEGQGRKALVIGCGLGDDAEELARREFDVCAFDISPTAVNWCRARFPRSTVAYEAANLLDAPKAWDRAFDFVFEANTIQSLPPPMQEQAIACASRFPAGDGELLAICRGADEGAVVQGPPWPLARSRLNTFASCGLREVSFEDCMDDESPPVRRFRVFYRRG